MRDEEQTAVLEERGRGRPPGASTGPWEDLSRTPITLPGVPIGARRSLEPGMWVTGRYHIQGLLGEGGMGRIWLAEDVQEHRRVALKEMQVPAGLPPGKVEELVLMFRHEFFAMKRLQHPGTLKVFDCGMTESGNRFITMEVVGGQDLSRLARQQVLDTRTLYRILIQMAQVLAFIHSRLYVHCDIKASNVRITETGAVKLMDFGVMHQLGTPNSGRLKGTLEYLAPEWQRGASIDGRADLYSLGVMAFFLATRQLPFKGTNAAALLAAHYSEPVPRPSRFGPVDPMLEDIILVLLAKDPRERFQDASELLGALCHASGEPLPEEPLAARASYLHVPEVVGREEELEMLLGAIQEAGRGQSRAVLLGAPAGVGKSRLLRELELRAQLAGIPFGVGWCRAEGLAPLAPITQALRALVPHTPPELLARLGPLLGKLMPALATGPAPIFPDAGSEKMAVFGALSEWLQTLGLQFTFVLCVEDLHWADSASLEVLNVIIRALHGTHALVVGAFRSNELNRLSLAFETVDEGLTARLELAPLAARHLDALVHLALPGLEVPSGFVARLHATTGGNAFFVTECLRLLVEEGALRRVGGRWTLQEGHLESYPLPASIREAVLARLAMLPEDRVALLRLLAPAGRSLELPLVRALADLPESELFQALDELVERQFLLLVEGRCIFTHDTVHESLHESTPEVERRAHHGRIAEILQRLGGNRPGVARAVGYHFSRSDEPQRAIVPLLRAGQASIEAKALLDATLVLKEAAALLESGPHTPERVEQLIRTWVTLIEIGYVSDPPTSLLYAEKLFAHWAATVDVGEGRREALARLAAASAAPEAERSEQLRRVIREFPIDARMAPADVFWKQAELQILQSIALAIMGRTAEFHALLERVQAEHPLESPYRAGALIARGGLSAHTGRFAGLLEAQRAEVQRLRAFRDAVEHPPRRLAWALGMGCYFLNMNLALRGEPLDAEAIRDGFDVADTYGFTDIRIYQLQSQIVRASFIGDAATFVPPFSEKQELIRRLGHPRLPERNLAIYTPPYYLERGEHELVAAVVARGEQLSHVLPGDRWLKLYVRVYSACRDVLFEDADAARESLPKALEAARAGDFRMETLVLVYQARFELAQGRLEAAREAAEAALRRAVDPVLANPFDEILSRRALAPLVPVDEGDAHLSRALSLAELTGNVLQVGWVNLALAERWLGVEPSRAVEALDAAERAFTAAKATALLPRVVTLRAVLRPEALLRRAGGILA